MSDSNERLTGVVGEVSVFGDELFGYKFFGDKVVFSVSEVPIPSDACRRTRFFEIRQRAFPVTIQTGLKVEVVFRPPANDGHLVVMGDVISITKKGG